MRLDDSHHYVFYSADLVNDSPYIDLAAEEHHHLSRVLRMRPGDTVYVSSGRGVIVRGVVDSINDGYSRLRVEETVENMSQGEPVILALACLKKDAYELAVKHCTELGVTHFLPFACARAHITEYSQAFVDRLRRIALSSMKQSFRAVLPTIDPPVAYEAMVAKAAACASVVVADGDAAPLTIHGRNAPLMMVVGPEGGLIAAELDKLEATGAEVASVSIHRLRSETAAAALTSLIGLCTHSRP